MVDGDGGADQLSPEALHAELHELRRVVAAIRQEVTCGACRCVMEAPVALPCGHTFCSECARRSLLLRARCLEAHCTSKKIVTAAHLTPVRSLEAIALSLSFERARKNVPSNVRVRGGRRTYLPDKNKRLLLRHLRELRLNTDGTVDELAERYRDFVLRWNANLDKANPLPESKVVDLVAKAERERVNARVKKRSNMFHKKISDMPSQNKDKADSKQPEEGDDFSTLIAKLCQRENRNKPGARRRLVDTEAQDNNNENCNMDVMRTGRPTASDLAFMECSNDAAIIASQNNSQHAGTEESEMYKDYNPGRTTLLDSPGNAALISPVRTPERTPQQLRPPDDTQSTMPPPTPNRATAITTTAPSPARNPNMSLFQQFTKAPPSYGAGTVSLGPRRPSQRASPPPAPRTTPTRPEAPLNRNSNIGAPARNDTTPDKNNGRAANVVPPPRNIRRDVNIGPPEQNPRTPDRNGNIRRDVHIGPPQHNLTTPDGNGQPAITINIMPSQHTSLNPPSGNVLDYNSRSPSRNVGDTNRTLPTTPATTPNKSTQPSININILSQNDGANPPNSNVHNNNSGPARLTPQRRPWTAASPSVASPPRNTPQRRPWTAPSPSVVSPPRNNIPQRAWASPTSPPRYGGGQQPRAGTNAHQTTANHAQPPQQQLPEDIRARIERNRLRAVELQLAKRRRLQEEQNRGALRR